MKQTIEELLDLKNTIDKDIELLKKGDLKSLLDYFSNYHTGVYRIIKIKELIKGHINYFNEVEIKVATLLTEFVSKYGFKVIAKESKDTNEFGKLILYYEGKTVAKIDLKAKRLYQFYNFYREDFKKHRKKKLLKNKIMKLEEEIEQTKKELENKKKSIFRIFNKGYVEDMKVLLERQNALLTIHTLDYQKVSYRNKYDLEIHYHIENHLPEILEEFERLGFSHEYLPLKETQLFRIFAKVTNEEKDQSFFENDKFSIFYMDMWGEKETDTLVYNEEIKRVYLYDNIIELLKSSLEEVNGIYELKIEDGRLSFVLNYVYYEISNDGYIRLKGKDTSIYNLLDTPFLDELEKYFEENVENIIGD